RRLLTHPSLICPQRNIPPGTLFWRPANTNFSYTSLRSLKRARNGVLSAML
ncbi:hypothetical protein BJX76DRAFT_340763, partial [Aspergillus varians]